ncbi:CsgG/HfaB family protein [Variovorax ginsengisoli]|uniref:CsgG/HfaB family protein n=1 Tax=Variovorax ginsengisoli TaxID=363844 RepID=A0ABT8S783_9BURK|nr:CsgG/HfaB family protein [Variovorax ginsengisoli]MDN8615510.1 CsgG/HfaB family protein [Variovorax ginsengisoli]MDO1534680.1 CsgG/HfaB family protein [Variovorax ginsengisoli]
MKFNRLALAALVALSVAACGKARPPEAAVADAPPAAPAAPVAPMPDVGKVGTVTVNAKGTGASAAEAVDEAIRFALKQANGQTVDLSSEQFKLTLSLARGKDAEALRTNAFAEHIVQSAGGAITGFKVNQLDGPDSRGFYKADIDAEVAKFTPSAADSKKLKIVIAPLRFDSDTFAVGGRSVAADKVAEDLRQQILAALTNTGRFTVLDRDLGGEVAQELDMISSGQAPRAEFGKLGQAMSADVVWVGKIASFAYNRHVRKLQTSDRELVSYSGGWAVSQKLVNVATRQVMLSESMRGEAPSVAATTLGTGVDGGQISEGMQNDIANRIVSGIVSRTFPVTVISLEGNAAVLSQGGQAVREGARYQLVHMGKEMFDPQTRQSLGRVESDCCEVVIDRVTPTMAQGRLDRVQMSLDGLQPGALQLRGMLPARVAAVAQNQEAPAPAGKPKPAVARSAAAPAAPKAAPVDDKW